MAVDFQPNSVNRPGGPKRDLPRRQQRRADQREEEVFTPPSRAEINFIPSTESIETLVRSAVSALRRGVYWDRGTILNILT